MQTIAVASTLPGSLWETYPSHREESHFSIVAVQCSPGVKDPLVRMKDTDTSQRNLSVLLGETRIWSFPGCPTLISEWDGREDATDVVVLQGAY